MVREREDAWTGQFVQKALAGHSCVESVELLGPKLLRVHRKNDSPVVAATIATDFVDAESYMTAINGTVPSVDYVVNIPAESVVGDDAIQLARQEGIGIGQFKNLKGALGVSDVSRYISRDLTFVEQSLPQHDRVESIERLTDRQYLVNRHDLPAVTVVFLHEYDLTVDHVRTAKSRYGSFNAIVITNPNGNATADAERLAKTLGFRVRAIAPEVERKAL